MRMAHILLHTSCLLSILFFSFPYVNSQAEIISVATSFYIKKLRFMAILLTVYVGFQNLQIFLERYSEFPYHNDKELLTNY